MFGCKHFTPNFSGFFIYDNKRLRSRLLLYMTIENCEAGFLSYMTIENLHKAENSGGFPEICQKSIFPARRISFPNLTQDGGWYTFFKSADLH